MITLRSTRQLFLVGAVLGTLGDGFHVMSHTTGYSRPTVLGMSWLVPLIFGVAVVALGLTPLLTDRLCRRTLTPYSWIQIWSGVAIFMGLYALTAFLPASNVTIVIMLNIAALLLWIYYDLSWAALLHGALVAIIGAAVEIALIHVGFFFYSDPDFYGIPLWLPVLYFCGSIVVANLGRRLTS